MKMRSEMTKEEAASLKRLLKVPMIVFVLCAAGLALAASNAQDKPGSKDHPLFSRMPGFRISGYQEIEFSRYEFPVGDNKKTAVEGRYYEIRYQIIERNNVPSALQIARNYINAAKSIGGQAIYEKYWANIADVVLKIAKNNMETWVELKAWGVDYNLYIIEKQAMEQDVTADAASMAQSIKATGRAAIYGIYFDSGKAAIKPESEPALQEIAKLLKADAKLKLYVVGHTDNVGAFEYNLKLSRDRADAVVKALVEEYGIAAARLQPFGAGPTSPVESNATEEGRAKNRRVELVEQ